METSYDVKVWKIETYRGRGRRAIACAGSLAVIGTASRFTMALADAFRSDWSARRVRARPSSSSPVERC